MPLKRTRVRSPFPETPRVRDSAAAAHGNCLSQAGGSLSPTFRPHSCCSLSTVTMPLGQMNELPKLGEDHQDPREKHSLLESQLFGDEVTEGAVASPASSPVSSTPSSCSPMSWRRWVVLRHRALPRALRVPVLLPLLRL